MPVVEAPKAVREEPAPTIALGRHHVCQRIASGEVRCAGANGGDQLGDGYTPFRARPVAVAPSAAIATLALGGRTTCFTTRDGELRCWGPGRATPVAIEGARNVLEVFSDSFEVCARTKTGIGCFSDEELAHDHPSLHAVQESRQATRILSARSMLLADGTTRAIEWRDPAGSTITFGEVRKGAIEPKTIHALRAHATWVGADCALERVGGPVRCWLGPEVKGDTKDIPVRSGLEHVQAVSSGTMHACAVLSEGRVACWGNNEHGQLGVPKGTRRSDAPLVVEGLADAIAIGVGFGHSCALDKAGAVWCWGASYSGQLGDGTTNDRATPARVEGLPTIASLAVGTAHACALSTEGKLSCWGWDDRGQLGDGGLLRAEQRGAGLVVGLHDAREIAAGTSHTCARRANGEVVCWGKASEDVAGCVPTGNGEVRCFGYGSACGRMFDGHTETFSVPARVADLPPSSQLVARGERTCLRGDDGVHRCFRAPSRCEVSGELRAETFDVPGLDARDRLSFGAATCALRDGSVRCAAKPDAPEQAPRFDAVAGLGVVTQLAQGKSHVCALEESGTVRCWGENPSGQLGAFDGARSEAPVAIAGLDDAVAIAAGHYHTCALRRAGDVVCWGEAGLGAALPGAPPEVDKASVAVRTPVAVSGLERIVELAAAGESTCARDDRGAVRCFGAIAPGGAVALLLPPLGG